MSHFTRMKTHFKNLFYLEKALDRLNISYKRQLEKNNSSDLPWTNLIVPQEKNSDISFVWSSQEYELVVDTSFWQQKYPIKSFIDQIAQLYVSEVVVNESHKIGFQPIKYQKNSDGSNTLVLERWNH